MSQDFIDSFESPICDSPTLTKLETEKQLLISTASTQSESANSATLINNADLVSILEQQINGIQNCLGSCRFIKMISNSKQSILLMQQNLTSRFWMIEINQQARAYLLPDQFLGNAPFDMTDAIRYKQSTKMPSLII